MPPILVPFIAKRIATQILVIAKLNGGKYFIQPSQEGITCSKLTTEAQVLRCENYSGLRMKKIASF